MYFAPRHMAPPKPRWGRPLVVHNIALLMLIQISSLAVPLTTMPFLTRVLGPAAWGQVAATQALATTLAIIVEYGFQYTATRSVSLSRDDPRSLRRIAAEVTAAKVILSIVCLGFGGAVFLLVPGFQESWQLFAWGVAYAVLQGWSPIWFFQGIEELQGAAAVDVLSKVASAAWIFVVVRSGDDATLVVASQAVMTAVATTINLFRMSGIVGPFTLPLSTVRQTLTRSFALFLFRATITVYSAGSTALLRGMATSVVAGNYANADRLTGAAKSLIVPVGQVMFPRISRLHNSHPGDAKTMMLRSLAGVTIPFTAVGALGVVLSPTLLPLFFGPDYGPTVPMFQVLCVTLPLVAASNVLGIQWMLARGNQRAFNVIIIASALISVTSMVIAVPAAGGMGMAWSVVAAETFSVVAMGLHAFLWKEE